MLQYQGVMLRHNVNHTGGDSKSDSSSVDLTPTLTPFERWASKYKCWLTDWIILCFCPKGKLFIYSLTLCIQMDFPIQKNTTWMGLSMNILRGHRLKIQNKYLHQSLKIVFSKQCRPRWNMFLKWYPLEAKAAPKK